MPGADRSNLNLAYGYGVAQTVVQVLKQCGDELTRDNVMKQAANLRDFRSPVFLEGIKANTSPTGYFVLEQLHMMKFNGQSWELFGPMLSATTPAPDRSKLPTIPMLLSKPMQTAAPEIPNLSNAPGNSTGTSVIPVLPRAPSHPDLGPGVPKLPSLQNPASRLPNIPTSTQR